MGKMRDLFKKIGATKVTVHTKMETIKDKNDKDLKKQKRLSRGGKSTWKNYIEKVLMTQTTAMV